MNNIRLFVVLVLLYSLPIQAQQQNKVIPKNGKVKYYSNNNIRSCYLSEDYTYDDFLMPAGSLVNFFKSGTPSTCKISREASFNGLLLPANTTVLFNLKGQKISFWLSENTRIQGVMVASSSDGIGNRVHKNGKLKAIWLAEDEEIDEVPCTSSGSVFRFGFKVIKLGTKRMVWFYDNGKLQQAMLSRDIEIQGISFKKGEIIYFDKEGKVDRNAILME